MAEASNHFGFPPGLEEGLALRCEAQHATDGHSHQRLVGPRPVPVDGFDTWQALGRPCVFAWALGPAEDVVEGTASVTRGSRGPQRLQPPEPVLASFTVAIWVRFWGQVGDNPATLLEFGSTGEFLVLRAAPGGGSALELSGNPCAHAYLPHDRWMLLLVVRMGADAKCSAHGAWDAMGVRHLGELGSIKSDATLSGLGGGSPSGRESMMLWSHVAEVAMWKRALTAKEQTMLFASNGASFGCMSREQAEVMLAGRPPLRTEAQETEFQARLELTRAGGAPPGVADFSHFSNPGGFKVSGTDLPTILGAVVASGSVEQLKLGAAHLEAEDVCDVVTALQELPGRLNAVDLTGCTVVGELGRKVVDTFPYGGGYSLEAAACGLPEEDVRRLRNQTAEAQRALHALAEELQDNDKMNAEYLAQQDALEDLSVLEESRDDPPPPPPPSHHPLAWRRGIDGPARLAYNEFRDANRDGLQAKTEEEDKLSWHMVDKAGEQIALSGDEYEFLSSERSKLLGRVAGLEDEEEPPPVDINRPGVEELMNTVADQASYVGFMVWNGVRPNADEVEALRRQQREDWDQKWRHLRDCQVKLSTQAKAIYDLKGQETKVASGQLIAHFSYLCLGRQPELGEKLELEPLSRFGLKRLSDAPRAKPRNGTDLHQAYATGLVNIDAATGRGYGQDSLELTLRGNTECAVVVQRGTIFQHVDWVHRQNLLVAVDAVLDVPAGGQVSMKLHAYCMNASCACARGNPMQLTEFYFDDVEVLKMQCRVWNHFQTAFGLK